MDTNSISTITKMQDDNRHQPSGIAFPWRLTIHAGTEKEYCLDFETLENAAEALKHWHGKD